MKSYTGPVQTQIKWMHCTKFALEFLNLQIVLILMCAVCVFYVTSETYFVGNSSTKDVCFQNANSSSVIVCLVKSTFFTSVWYNNKQKIRGLLLDSSNNTHDMNNFHFRSNMKVVVVALCYRLI